MKKTRQVTSFTYDLFQDIASTAGYSPNLASVSVGKALDDGSLRIDYAETNTDGIPLTAAALTSAATTGWSFQGDQPSDTLRRTDLDDLVARVVARPEANPWEGCRDPAAVVRGLILSRLHKTLEAALSHPQCPSASQIEGPSLTEKTPASNYQRELPLAPLHYASAYDAEPSVLTRLIAHGFDPNAIDAAGYRPLAYAVSSIAVDSLIRQGASPWFADAIGTPISTVWTRLGIAASNLSDFNRAARLASVHAAPDPMEVFAAARGLVGINAINDAMSRHRLRWDSTDASGLTVLDHVALGLLLAPRRTIGESAKHAGLLRSIDRVLTSATAPQAFGPATAERVALADLALTGGLTLNVQVALDRLDQDDQAHIISAPDVSMSILLSQARADTDEARASDVLANESLFWGLLERASRAIDGQQPTQVPLQDAQSYGLEEATPAQRRLSALVKHWGQQGKQLEPLQLAIVQVSHRLAPSDPQAALHALLPWLSPSIVSRWHSEKPLDAKGLYTDFPLQVVLSDLLSSGIAIDASRPGFSERAEAAVWGYNDHNMPAPPGLLSLLDRARLVATTPSSAQPSRKSSMRL